MRGRHLKPKHRHARPGPPPGWDPADQLAMAQSGDTPPMGFPVVTPAPYQPPPPVFYPRPGMDPTLRWVLAGFSALACLVLGAVLILALAFAMGPPPATAEAPSGVQVTVDHGKVRLKDGTYTITRRSP